MADTRRRVHGRLGICLAAAVLLAIGAQHTAAIPMISSAFQGDAEVFPALVPRPALPVPCPALSSGDSLGVNVSEGLDGRLHDCFRVGHMAPGEHRFAILAYPGRGGTRIDGSLPLHITPSRARPGAVVHLSGKVPGITQRRDFADICWSTCDGPGLQFAVVEVHWAAAGGGRFDIDLRVPATAWLGTTGPQPLRAGDVTVTLPCLSYAQPCTALAGHLRLEGPTPTQCLPGHPCARLELSTRTARFGDEVEVGGFAPLIEIVGTNPFGYYLQVDPPPQRTFAEGRLSAFTLAETTLHTRPAISLRRSSPVWLQRDDGDPLATDSTDPERLAFCQPEGIRVTEDGGATWRILPVDGARRDAAADEHLWPPDAWGGSPPCEAVALDSAHRHSYYAAFSAVPQGGSAPPVYRVGYVTADAGRSWRRVPTPSGEAALDFAGFLPGPHAMLALFFIGGQGPPRGVLVEESTDGGLHWSPGHLGCPRAAGCVRFTGTREVRGCAGPLGTPQLVEGSADGGRFSPLAYPASVNTCDLAELVGLQDGTVLLLLGGDWLFPVMVSADQGATWHVRAIPELPNPAPDTWSAYLNPDLQILPDGSLLARGAAWELLPPSASAWCSVSAQVLPPNLSGRVLVDGPRLWWVEDVETSGPAANRRARSVPLGDIRCS